MVGLMLHWYTEEAGQSPKGGMAMVKITIEIDASTLILLILTAMALSATR